MLNGIVLALSLIGSLGVFNDSRDIDSYVVLNVETSSLEFNQNYTEEYVEIAFTFSYYLNLFDKSNEIFDSLSSVENTVYLYVENVPKDVNILNDSFELYIYLDSYNFIDSSILLVDFEFEMNFFNNSKVYNAVGYFEDENGININDSYYEQYYYDELAGTELITLNFYTLFSIDFGNYFNYIADTNYDNGYNDGYIQGLESGSFDFIHWINDAVGGFFNFEILPNFSIGSIFGTVIGVFIAIYILKVFVGG